MRLEPDMPTASFFQKEVSLVLHLVHAPWICQRSTRKPSGLLNALCKYSHSAGSAFTHDTLIKSNLMRETRLWFVNKSLKKGHQNPFLYTAIANIAFIPFFLKALLIKSLRYFESKLRIFNISSQTLDILSISLLQSWINSSVTCSTKYSKFMRQLCKRNAFLRGNLLNVVQTVPYRVKFFFHTCTFMHWSS